MKKLFFSLTFTLTLTFSNAQHQISFQPGLTLTFDVSGTNGNYQYIAEITAADDKGIAFDWQMTAPVNKSGKIFIPKLSLDTANWVYFILNESKKTEIFTDKCTMFLPRNVYNDLAEGETARFMCDACIRGVTIPSATETRYDMLMDGKPYSLTALQGYGDYNTGKFVILKDESYPLILVYDGTFKIELSEIRY